MAKISAERLDSVPPEVVYAHEAWLERARQSRFAVKCARGGMAVIGGAKVAGAVLGGESTEAVVAKAAAAVVINVVSPAVVGGIINKTVDNVVERARRKSLKKAGIEGIKRE